MPVPRLRPMTPADIDPASAAVLADDWGDRRAWFSFAVGHEACDVVVADADGEIVGTGVTTRNGSVAWIGTIWVAPGWRGRGLGQKLTEATIDAAESTGAKTLVLVATEAGRPLYERLGFRVTTTYRTMEARGRRGQEVSALGSASGGSAAGGSTAGGRVGRPARSVRAWRPADLAAMTRLDAVATGEDRGHLLAAFATSASSRVVTAPDDTVRGFIVRAPWGGGATIAPDLDDAVALLDARRDAYPADRHVRAGVLAENEAGILALEEDGWREAWRAPRLERGETLAWDPAAIWGQFNHALG